LVYYPDFTSNSLGFLIGKNGDRLRHIMHVSGTLIDIEDENDVKNALILGFPDDVEFAKKLIDKILDG